MLLGVTDRLQDPKDVKTEEDQKVEPQAAAAVEPTEGAAPVASSTEAPSTSTKPDGAVAETSSPSKAADAAKDKKRPSFFNTLSSRKEKKAEVVPEGEHVDAEGKKTGNASPMPKLSGLFRKPSRGAKALFDTKKDAAPATSDSKSTEAPTETSAVPAEGASATENTTTSEATQVAPATSTVDEISSVPTGHPPQKPAPEVQAAA